MKLLVTGAFGNVGVSTLLNLLEREKYEITCFDKPTRRMRKRSRQFKGRVKIIWGDLRDVKKVEKAVEGQDVVLHIGAVIPPEANKNESKTLNINFGGTKNIVDAILKQEHIPKIIYTSSVACYGDLRELGTKEIDITQPLKASPGDHYAITKIKSEEYIQNSGIDHIIFRLSYIPNTELIKLTPLMFRMPLNTPMEFTHTLDTGLALTNSLEHDDMWNNIYNLGGGKKCQVFYKEFLEKMLPLMGIGMLPDEAFSDDSFHCCYYNTTELQKKLNFQRYSLEDVLQEMVDNTKATRVLAKIFKPIIRPFLLSLSPYYRKNKRRERKVQREYNVVN